MTRSLQTALLLLALVGCNNTPEAAEATAEPTTGSEEGNDANAQRMMALTPPGAVDEGASCELRTVYFEYDSDVLTASSRDAVGEAVDCIRAQHATAELMVTGATDPQGSEEYNLALGERRAQSVRSYLEGLGVDGARIRTMSMGEEMATGEDEAGYAQDRNAQTRVRN